MRAVGIVLLTLVLAGCWSDSVRVGSKDFTENRILAEMFALLLKERGIPVERQFDLGSTEVVIQALKSDAIDLYPEYTGTGLSLMGAPQFEDGDAGYEYLSRTFAETGLVLLERLGFRSGYAVLVRPNLASTERLQTIADLARVDDRVRLGVTRSFAERPRDGLEPFLGRFGLTFAGVEIFADGDMEGLYDALLEGRVDVVVGLTTDPEIADYELTQLSDTTDFFPVYEAAPLTSEAALARHPEIAEVLSLLAGKIDGEMMRELNGAVRLDGRPVGRVARQALFDLGLVATPPRERTPVFTIATAPATSGTEAGIATLRAVRQAMRGRNVDFQDSFVPLDAVAAHEARLALTPAVSVFVEDNDHIVRDERFEAIAAVGSTFLHALSLTDAPVQPVDARTIATGPVGSATHRLGSVIGAARDGVTVVPLADESPRSAAEALREGAAEVALVLAVPGRADLRVVLDTPGDITLVDADGWWRSSARLDLPVMRPAQINADVYRGVARTISTLATQLVLFGPAAPERFALGRQGPSSFFEELRPLQDHNITAIDRNLGPHSAVDPHLRRATALTPQVHLRNDRLNAHPGRAVLMIVIVAFVIWAGWLLVRPERDDRPEKDASASSPDA